MGKLADIDEVMHGLGLSVLHPGGLEKTDEMARLCGIGSNRSLLDIGAGTGASACYLARKHGCRVTAIDSSERMIRECRRRAQREAVADVVNFLVADAYRIPFADDYFDIVMAECTTTLLDKKKAFCEMMRVCKAGGYVADLEMTWQNRPPDSLSRKLYKLWDGYETMTVPQWKELLERLGLQAVKAVDISYVIPRMEAAVKKELGLGGMLKLGCKLALRSGLRKTLSEYQRLFRENAGYVGCAYFAGRKPQ